MSSGITTTIKYYSFNGKTVATRKGSTLSYLHTDHLNSNSMATNASGGVIGGEVYYNAYGTVRSGNTINLQRPAQKRRRASASRAGRQLRCCTPA